MYIYKKKQQWKRICSKIEHIASHILKKNNLHLVDATKYSKKKFLAKYGDSFFVTVTKIFTEPSHSHPRREKASFKTSCQSST